MLAISMAAPILIGCGKSTTNAADRPPIDDTRGGTMTPSGPTGGAPQQTGMSGKQKLMLLAGAAALYYMYKKHKNAQNQPANVQYYLSKNGRVYYRDANHQAHWVTPPSQGISVPESEAREFSGFQGYNGQNSGRNLVGLGSD
jgi:hypothetical protein